MNREKWEDVILGVIALATCALLVALLWSFVRDVSVLGDINLSIDEPARR